jgi:acetyl esterase/lipase
MLLGATTVASRAQTSTPKSAPEAAAVTTIRTPEAEVPFSTFASREAREAFAKMLSAPQHPSAGDVESLRSFHRKFADEQLAEMRTRYPVTIRTERMGGVRTDIVEPAQGVDNEKRDRLLINLHGGAFMWGAGSGALVEAVPIAAVGRIKVVTIDYRMAPEHKFPAASEDVAAVYGVLLKSHAPENVGLYGCSAGGILAAQSVAWFQAHDLPTPGAIASLCATGAELEGDSAFLAPLLSGQPPVPRDGHPLRLTDLPYFAGVDRRSALVYPIESDEVLAKFPPTLLLAGSRDFSASSLTFMHRNLRRVGVPADLFLFDGLGHAFIMMPGLPESREAYEVIARFFDAHLGRRTHE